MTERSNAKQVEGRALELLLAGDSETAVTELGAVLETGGPKLPPDQQFRLTLLFWDAQSGREPSEDELAGATLDLVAAPNHAGLDAWTALLTSQRLDKIERLFQNRTYGLAILEQMSHAPGETAMPEVAIAHLEQLGRLWAGERDRSRSVERLPTRVGSTCGRVSSWLHPKAARVPDRRLQKPLTRRPNEALVRRRLVHVRNCRRIPGAESEPP
jgi:hypothetical protein